MRNLPIYYSHGYRERDAIFNRYFGLLIQQHGFIPSLDPPSGDVNSAKLEKHLKHTVGLIAIVTNRGGEISPYIRYEIDIAIRARKPVLVFLEDTLPNNILPDFILRKRFSSRSFIREYHEHIHALKIFKSYVGDTQVQQYQSLTSQKSAIIIGFENAKLEIDKEVTTLLTNKGYDVIDYSSSVDANLIKYGLEHFNIHNSYLALCFIDELSSKASYLLGAVRSIQTPTILLTQDPKSQIVQWVPEEFQRRLISSANLDESMTTIADQIELYEQDFVELDKEGKIEEYVNSLSKNFSLRGDYDDDVRNQIINNIIMGDNIKNNSGNIIKDNAGNVFASHSGSINVSGSFNKIKDRFGEDATDALIKAAGIISGEGDQDAKEQFNSFKEELEKEQPRKSVLKVLWETLGDAVPLIKSSPDIYDKVKRFIER